MNGSRPTAEQVLSLLRMCDEANRIAVLKSICGPSSPDAAMTGERRTRHPLEERWGVSADVIMDSIARSPDLTQRGVRGIIAEAVFDRFVVPTAREWESVALSGEHAYDAALRNAANPAVVARVQVKLQRLEKHVPKLVSRALIRSLPVPPENAYVVEVQRTRTGKRAGRSTRPYRFGEFDVLAVCMHPSTHDWRRFSYTLADWLLPRKDDSELIQIMQPVSCAPDIYWTDDLGVCLDWYRAGMRRRLFH